MCVPSLNEIRESVFELSRTQVKMYGGDVTDVKPIYPKLSSGDINIAGSWVTFAQNVNG